MSRLITAFELAEFRVGAMAARTFEGHVHRARVPLDGWCARCQSPIGSARAFPTRMGYWLCGHCIRCDEGWTDVREANYEIFEKGQS